MNLLLSLTRKKIYFILSQGWMNCEKNQKRYEYMQSTIKKKNPINVTTFQNPFERVSLGWLQI